MTTVLKTKFVVDSRKTLIAQTFPKSSRQPSRPKTKFSIVSSCSFLIEKPNDSAVLMTASLTVALVLINVAAVQSQFQQNWSFGTGAIISNSHKKSEQLFPRV